MARRIRITVDGTVFHAVLQENRLAERIAAMCPLTLDCVRGGDHEYYASLPEKTGTEDCPATTTGHRNGMYFFEGWNALSLVFKDCDTAPYQIHHIGDFEEDVSAALKEAGRNIRVRCEEEGGNG